MTDIGCREKENFGKWDPISRKIVSRLNECDQLNERETKFAETMEWRGRGGGAWGRWGTTTTTGGTGGICRTFLRVNYVVINPSTYRRKLMKFNRNIYINQERYVYRIEKEHIAAFITRHVLIHTHTKNTQICPCFVIKCFVSIYYTRKLTK